ncbi:MAG: CHAP domain-containing protein [Pseudomonadota bacterium]
MLVLGAMPAAAIQCVPYAREVSGLNLKGNAWQWWNAAAGVYERGRAPKDGAVLVFSRQGSMRYGHVSVVTRVVSNRLVLVDHANWAPAGSEGRGKVTQAVPVLDVSPRNDWSQVRVWYRPADDYGSKVYKAEGFVYRPGAVASAPRPPVEKVALSRAARVFPADKAFAPHAEPDTKAETRQEVAAAPAVSASPAPVAVASAPVVPVVSEHTAGHPSTDDLIKVASHVFRPRQTASSGTIGDFIFN